MEMQKSVIFLKKNLKINISKIKKNYKVRYHCYYKCEYRGSVHCIYSLRNSVPRKSFVVFHKN